MSKMGSVHEPEAELHSAEDAIEDAARVRAWFREQEHAVSLRVPLSALLEALDNLQPNELREVARRAEERLLAKQ